MTACNLRLLLVAAIFLSNCITWTASRHHYTHNVSGHRSRHRRQGAGLYLSASYVIPGGEGTGWGEWGEISPCSRTCGGGVASRKRICLQIGPDGQKQCTGGDTKYFSCQTQDCPEGSGDFRSQQCSEFDDKEFRGLKYKWMPYTTAPNKCELNCMPRGERFYYRHKAKVTDGTRCSEDSLDVCVDGKCQPVGCDMMLGSNAREDKCRVCRGNGSSCHTTGGLYDAQNLVKGYNDILLIPEGSTTIVIEEIGPSSNYLALRAKNGSYYLNGDYHIDFPRSIEIAGALWTYERNQLGFPAPDKLRCQGPTNEPLYLSLLLQEDNVGIQFEYSVPNTTAPPTHKVYNWVHEEFTPCSVSCGGGFQTRNVTCRSREELEIVDEGLCDEGLRPVTNQTCNTEACPAGWVEGPWGACSKRCGEGGVMSRNVTCEKVVAPGYSSVVPDSQCFDLLGPKPELFQKCNEDAPCPQWYIGSWKACDKMCGQGEQTRQVVCFQKSNGRVEVLDDSECSTEKPPHTKPCMLQYCEGVDWMTTDWFGCDSCLSKNRTRHVLCATNTSEVVEDKFCAYHTRPSEQEPCTEKLPECTYMWYATQWSECSVKCGKGNQTRNVFCGLFDGKAVTPVNDSNCDMETRYKDTRPCSVPPEKCPAQWYAGPWPHRRTESNTGSRSKSEIEKGQSSSKVNTNGDGLDVESVGNKSKCKNRAELQRRIEACSKECGSGNSLRKVVCFQGKEISENCTAETVLDTLDICNKEACPAEDDDLDYCDEEFVEEGLDVDDDAEGTLDDDDSGSGGSPLGEPESSIGSDEDSNSTTTAESTTDTDISTTDSSTTDSSTTDSSTTESSKNKSTTNSYKSTTPTNDADPDKTPDTNNTVKEIIEDEDDPPIEIGSGLPEPGSENITTISDNNNTTPLLTEENSNDVISGITFASVGENSNATTPSSPEDTNETDVSTTTSDEKEDAATSATIPASTKDSNETDVSNNTSEDQENATTSVTTPASIKDTNETDVATTTNEDQENAITSVTPPASTKYTNETYVSTTTSGDQENATTSMTTAASTKDINDTTVSTEDQQNATTSITTPASTKDTNETNVSTTTSKDHENATTSVTTPANKKETNETDVSTTTSEDQENATTSVTTPASTKDTNETIVSTTTSEDQENATTSVTTPASIKDTNETDISTTTSEDQENATTSVTTPASTKDTNETIVSTTTSEDQENATTSVTIPASTKDTNETDISTTTSEDQENTTTIVTTPASTKETNETDVSTTTSEDQENATTSMTTPDSTKDSNDTAVSTTTSDDQENATTSVTTPASTKDINDTAVLTTTSEDQENATISVTTPASTKDTNEADVSSTTSEDHENATTSVTTPASKKETNETDVSTTTSEDQENATTSVTTPATTKDTNETDVSTTTSGDQESATTSVTTPASTKDTNETDISTTTSGDQENATTSVTTPASTKDTNETDVSTTTSGDQENATTSVTTPASTKDTNETIVSTTTSEDQENATTSVTTPASTKDTNETDVSTTTSGDQENATTSVTTPASTKDANDTDVSTTTSGDQENATTSVTTPTSKKDTNDTDVSTTTSGDQENATTSVTTPASTKDINDTAVSTTTSGDQENATTRMTTAASTKDINDTAVSTTTSEDQENATSSVTTPASKKDTNETDVTTTTSEEKENATTTTEVTPTIIAVKEENGTITDSTKPTESYISTKPTESYISTKNATESYISTTTANATESDVSTTITATPTVEATTMTSLSNETEQTTILSETITIAELSTTEESEASSPSTGSTEQITSETGVSTEEITSETTTEVEVDQTSEEISTTPESTTEGVVSSGMTSLSAGVIFTSGFSTLSARMCKRRRPSDCKYTEFGCCPDNKTPAEGPFDKGCKKPETCSDSEFGCCPDGVSPAQGLDEEGCPRTPCAETLFGCCVSDNYTAAEGNDQEGCPPYPPACFSSEFGCCADNETEAIGPQKEGCPETETTRSVTETSTEGETTSFEETSTVTETSSLEPFSTASEPSRSQEPSTLSETSSPRKSSSEGSTAITERTTVLEGCSITEFGCCYDNETAASGANGQGCPCDATEFGCCPDGELPAEGPEMQGCQGDCRNTKYGCCSDNETPAHGPDFEGCCLQTAFGCCPDNRKPAHGPHFEGCECKHTLYGCCPDNVTHAQGPDNKGCGCQYTQHGCCPDRHTEALGPEYEGCACSTFQFGCCPDGIRIARGPEYQGCNCRESQFGCCSDGETPASSADASGCNCAASKFGCCLDGTTEAKGPKFEGCTDMPENKQAVCILPSDSGPCHKYSMYWFYDMTYGGCSRFWYGGCEGNGNKFRTQEDCQDICIRPAPKDVCKLPEVKGPCDGDIVRWYYNSTQEQCMPFRYGGCLGNSNNFDTRELCQAQCAPDTSADQCSLPMEQGSCAGNYSRWGYNKETGQCEQFTWGGCEGNPNRFGSEGACLLRCNPPGTLKPQCTEPQDTGNCTEKEALWSFSQSENRCMPFYYSGCGGNNNRFESRTKCQQTCPSAYEPHKCTLPAATGECSNYRQRWFYDSSIKRCRLFYYGGCGGNENNFESEVECDNTCSETLTTSTTPPTSTTRTTITTSTTTTTRAPPAYTEAPQTQRPQPEPDREDFCLLEVDPGPCNDYTEHWAYDSTTGVCKTFQYGGCGGNRNNFINEEYCTYYCRPVQDICQLPMASGPCGDSEMRWFYNTATDSCSQFTYGGCEGNANRFESREACESRCRSDEAPQPETTAITSTTVVFTSTTPAVLVENRFAENPDCRISDALEACSIAGTVWYYDQSRFACVSHQNLETGYECRNTGVFPTQEACERSCGAFRGVDVCEQTVDPGPCRSFELKVYFDQANGECRQFYYGGCLGGGNRFSTVEECMQVCKPESVSTSTTTTAATSTTTTPSPSQVPGECLTPSSLKPCGANITTFYYDSDRKQCVESNIGGCQYANSYRTEEECERTCGAFRGLDVCGARLDPGRCRGSIPKYYWHAATAKCELYAYGGCEGGPNRFSTIDECEEVCGSTGPATEDDCKLYKDACQELRCEYGVQRTYTPEGCQRCSCGPPPIDCEPALQECEAMICTYGVQRTIGDDGCPRCQCYEDPCVAANCSLKERCDATAYTDPETQEPRYTARCIPDERYNNVLPPDCEEYNRACAALRCEFGVQRTRQPGGCDSCACVQRQVDCAPLESECERIKCNYNVIKTKDDDGCTRCRCSEDPCKYQTCADDERCVVVEYKYAISMEERFYTECRKVNKPGLCPVAEGDVTYDECKDDCKNDAGCRGDAKCCQHGCSRVCLYPLPPTTAAPTTLLTTHAPELKRAPEPDVRQKKNYTMSEGGKATLRCLFHGNPPPKITWRHGEVTIDGNLGRYRLLSDGALEIVSLLRSDSGIYICVADNGLGISTQKIHLVVSDPVPLPAGIAEDENAVITGELGKPLTVRCLAYGYPAPLVYWYRGQNMVPFNDAVYMARRNVLLIRSLSIETIGEYTCHAYNGKGSAASWVVAVKAYRPEGILIEHAYLVPQEVITAMTRARTHATRPTTVAPTTASTFTTTTTTTEVPVIRIYNVPVDAHIQPVSRPYSVNGELQLTCELGGFPDPEVYWTKDGNRLYPDERITISGSGGSVSRLTVARLTTGDGGLYGCTASNDYSSDTDTVKITVNQGVSVPAKCTDNKFFANCALIVRNNFCRHKYYSNFCCKSCVEAGLLDPAEAELQADQPFRRK